MKKNVIQSISLILMITIILMNGILPHAAAAPETGLKARDDGFYEYYKEDGKLLSFDYLQTEDGKLYFFNSKGVGAEIDYVQADDHVIQVFDNTADSFFIVLGEEKAAVIDGMNGTIDPAAVARFFTDKPLIAIATHGHGDHTGGLNSFEEVYIGEEDFDMWRGSSGSDRFRMLSYDNYLHETGKTLDYTLLNLKEDIIETNPNITLLPLNDGDVFDLGGVSVEALSLIGHTPGSRAILIREDRMLITGDAANKYTQITGYPVESYCENLKAVKAREADYDDIYSSHGAITADGKNGSHMAPSLIDELIEGCESILNGSNSGVEPGPGVPTRWCYEMGPFGRADGKCGNFMFNPSLIWNPEGTSVNSVLLAGTADLGTLEVESVERNDDYYLQLLEAEKYNYRVMRNIPTAFEAEEYEEYIALAEKAVRGNRMGDKQKKLLDETVSFRRNMKRLLPREDVMWMLWGNIMPQSGHSGELDFENCYDNSDFRPFLVPYLLADQNDVKGNLIIVAGGGYSGRNNKTEGYPIAEAFNALGYNCFILQRRVTPYTPADTWMDMQRAIRLVKHEIKARALGGSDCILGAGFSGGSATVLGCIANYYGEISPSETDSAYIPDEIDALSADLDVAFCIYGPNYTMGSGQYKGLVTENSNLPAIFLAAGLMDNTGAPQDNLTLAASVMDKTMVEYHAFANAPHGFGVGTPGTNAPQWIALADGFADQAIAAKHAAQP